MKSIKPLATIVALAAAAFASTAALAVYPDHPVTVVVPFPPGGSSDATARQIVAKLGDKLGQVVIVDNKPGANGSIGAAVVAKAKPDGYTLLVGSIGVYGINPVLYKDLSYDPRRDFDLLTVAVRTPNALVANPKFPANTVTELIAYLKKNPDKVSFASSGTGSSDHLTAALFWQKTGTSGIHVPYKGGGQAISDLIGGSADVSFQNLGAVAQQIRAGRLKLLAVTADKRSPAFPAAPTMTEAGVSGLEVYSWQAVAAPTGLPREVIAKLQPALIAVLRDPEVVKRFDEIGFEVVANSSAEFGAFLTGELGRWKAVIDAGKITQSD
ncbi:MAG: Bug family tripartite tricarboxylate transporter substrate binding protein [Usitatibacter sp.]